MSQNENNVVSRLVSLAAQLTYPIPGLAPPHWAVQCPGCGYLYFCEAKQGSVAPASAIQKCLKSHASNIPEYDITVSAFIMKVATGENCTGYTMVLAAYSITYRDDTGKYRF
jgi:hypothetical protein